MMQVITPVGRLVAGHPMERNVKTDQITNLPKLGKDGNQLYETYVGIAIAKQGEAHWDLTEWGAKIKAEAEAGWKRGEHASPVFAWKIIDGDSAIPNKVGIAPNVREGYPGHWIINASSMLTVKCYHNGKYNPHEQIQNEKEIKRGDYCRLLFTVKPNESTQTPGMYINPDMFELTRAGIEIIPMGGGVSAIDAFGSVPAAIPAGALLDTAVAPQPAAVASQPAAVASPPPPPAVDLITRHEPKYSYNNQVLTMEEWLAFPGWTEELVNTHCTKV